MSRLIVLGFIKKLCYWLAYYNTERGAPSFLDALLLPLLLFFELDGRQHPVSSVFAFWIIEHLDVIRCLTGDACITEKGTRPALPRCV